ncbi:MAG: hypothetical protein U9P42_06075 [Candidatus Fermentibacteria bacterium]|nr:hypothetical protein [Candidatus Fermentibacteria bacterium]
MSDSEKDTLHMLAIFHYVIAGLIALVACIPLIHLTVGLSLTVGAIASEEPAMGMAGVFFTLIASFIILLGWGLAVLVFLAGKNLDRQTKYRFCMIGAGVLCIFMPLGTILGVFTLVTLQDDSVKAMFNGNDVQDTEELPVDSVQENS